MNHLTATREALAGVIAGRLLAYRSQSDEHGTTLSMREFAEDAADAILAPGGPIQSVSEVQAAALESAARKVRADWAPKRCPWVGFLDDRAAAIRTEKEWTT